jgi:hypothetical protein
LCFFAVTQAPGGDAYFAVLMNSIVQAVTYAYYLACLLGMGSSKAIEIKNWVTGLHMVSFVVGLCHALFVLWKGTMPVFLACPLIVALLNMLVLHTNFHYEEMSSNVVATLTGHSAHSQPSSTTVTDNAPGSQTQAGNQPTALTALASPFIRRLSLPTPRATTPRLIFSFDSSGWGFVYHFGVAKYIAEHVLDRFEPSTIAFSGSSGGSLVAACLCLGVPINDISMHVIACQPQCQRSPWNMLPCAERAMDVFIPSDAHKPCSGRLRVLLTRIIGRFPFVMGEVATNFPTRDDLITALRGSCHIPLVAGAFPYKGKYFDGFFWMSLFVPWRGYEEGDCVIKSSSIGSLTAHIKPSIPIPPWWLIFPPNMTVLHGMFEQGYADASKFFSCWENETHDTGKPFPGVKVNPKVLKTFRTAAAMSWAKFFVLFAAIGLFSLVLYYDLATAQ